MRFLALLLLSILAAVAQVIPNQFIVELQGQPGAQSAAKGVRAASDDAVSRIRAEQANVRQLIEARQARVIDAAAVVANALIVEAASASAAELAALPGVRKVYPVLEMKLELDQALDIHRVYQAMERIGGVDRAGAGVKIGVIDSGIVPDHPGFSDSSMTPPQGYPKFGRERDREFTSGKIIVARTYEEMLGSTFDPSPQDRIGHGTAVAMIAAGVKHQSPRAQISGVAPKAHLGIYKVFAGTGPSQRTSNAVVLRALEDAVIDRMDVVNMSLGSEPAPRLDDDVLAQAIERAAQLGVIVVKSAGNSGPDPNTLSSPATAPSAITAGASWNSRSFFGGGVIVDGVGPRFAQPGNGPRPSEPIEASFTDVQTVDPSGLACGSLPGDSMSGRIAVILRGTCNFEVKINNVQAAGAVGALVYTDEARPNEVVTMEAGTATLPAMLTSYANGRAILARIQEDPEVRGRLVFSAVAVPLDSNQLAPFSAKGPNVNDGIKPEIAAVGVAVYTATQNTDASDMFDDSRYVEADGTSFSSPMVAGAVAVVKSLRPGLTAEQYRSLIVNSASAFPADPVRLGGAQQTGAGLLNLDDAVRSTVALVPATLSFGAGGSTVDVTRDITITNVGSTTDTFTLSIDPNGSSTAPALSANSVELGPKASQTVSLRFNAASLNAGEYQGTIRVRGGTSEIDARVPYWYSVRSNQPSYITLLRVPASAPRGSLVEVLFRVSDASGNSILDTTPAVTAIAGGDVVSIESYDFFFPGVYRARLRMGFDVSNTFRFQAGELTRDLTLP